MKKFATALTSASLLIIGSASIAHAETASDESSASQGVIITSVCDGIDSLGGIVGADALAAGSAMCDPELPAPRDRSGKRVFSEYIPEWVLEIPAVEQIIDDVLPDDGSDDGSGDEGTDEGTGGDDAGTDDGEDTVEP